MEISVPILSFSIDGAKKINETERKIDAIIVFYYFWEKGKLLGERPKFPFENCFIILFIASKSFSSLLELVWT